MLGDQYFRIYVNTAIVPFMHFNLVQLRLTGLFIYVYVTSLFFVFQSHIDITSLFYYVIASLHQNGIVSQQQCFITISCHYVFMLLNQLAIIS